MAGIQRYEEVVNGVVISDNSRLVHLHDPQNNYHKTFAIQPGDDVTILARQYIDSRKSELGIEFKHLGWDGEWYLYGIKLPDSIAGVL